MLVDLETFQSEKPPLEQTRTFDAIGANTSTESSPNNSSSVAAVTNVNEWWKTFETFQSDVQYLKQIRREFKQARTELDEANADIVQHSERMKQQIAEALAKIEHSWMPEWMMQIYLKFVIIYFSLCGYKLAVVLLKSYSKNRL